jgi:hypothetical protein
VCRGRRAGPKGLVRRRFRTREEVRGWLEAYAEELETEIEAVEERIDALSEDEGDDA